MADMDDDDLLEALGVEAATNKASAHTAQEERLIAGFEDILRFVESHGRVPQHGEERDIFERLYAVRLDRLRGIPEARALLPDAETGAPYPGAKPHLIADRWLDEPDVLAAAARALAAVLPPPKPKRKPR